MRQLRRLRRGRAWARRQTPQVSAGVARRAGRSELAGGRPPRHLRTSPACHLRPPRPSLVRDPDRRLAHRRGGPRPRLGRARRRARVALRRLDRFAAHTETVVDDLLADGLRRTSKWFLFVVALAAAAKTLPALRGDARDIVGLVARVAFLLQAAAWGNGAISFWLQRSTAQRATHDKASLTTLNVLGLVGRVVLWTLIALLALDAFGVNVTALVTGLGIAGVAVALAVQNILGDVLASLSIALDKPFAIGDFIVVDTFQGTVEHIGSRRRACARSPASRSSSPTRSCSRRGAQLPAAHRAARRLHAHLPARHAARGDGAHPGARARGRSRPSRRCASTVALLGHHRPDAGGGDGVLRPRRRLPRFMDIQQRINLALLRRFAEEGVSLAVPTRSVVVRGGAEGDGRPAAATAGAAAGGATDD
jgi:small-conductance mechanosensitive channel